MMMIFGLLVFITRTALANAVVVVAKYRPSWVTTQSADNEALAGGGFETPQVCLPVLWKLRAQMSFQISIRLPCQLFRKCWLRRRCLCRRPMLTLWWSKPNWIQRRRHRSSYERQLRRELNFNLQECNYNSLLFRLWTERVT